MRKVLLIMFLCVVYIGSKGQDQQMIDSIIPMIKHDGSRNDMEIFYELGFQYASAKPTLSLAYFDEGRSIAYQLGDSLMIVRFNRLAAHVLRSEGKQEQALKIFLNILPVAKRQKFKREIGFILKSLAVAYSHMAHFDKGLEYNFRALEVWREENDSIEIADVLNNIGFVHYKVGNYDRAIDYFRQSSSIAEKIGLKKLARLTYANIGTAYVLKNDTAEANRWIEKSIVECSPDCSTDVMMTAEFARGYSSSLSGNLGDAKRHFERSHQLAVEESNPRFEAENLNSLAEIFRQERKFDLALEYLNRAQRICLEGDYRNLLALNYYRLFEVYRDQKQINKASDFLERYVGLNDSIHSRDVRNKIAIMQIEFDQEQHASQITYREKLLAKQKTQMALISVLCLLFILLALGLFIVLKEKKRANILLDQRVSERTRELESNKVALERAYVEQGKLLKKASQSIKSALATQKGLTQSIAGIERPVGVELEITAKRVESELNSLSDELLRMDLQRRDG